MSRSYKACDAKGKGSLQTDDSAWSFGISVDLVRTYKKMGAKLHAEATPHHFTLTEDAVLEHGTLAKMNPPLRTEKDRQAIIQGLADGTRSTEIPELICWITTSAPDFSASMQSLATRDSSAMEGEP